MFNSTSPAIIAIDTEFQHAHTLLIQTAHRTSGGVIQVQLYRSPAIPDLPDDFRVGDITPSVDFNEKIFEQVSIRPTQSAEVRVTRGQQP
jgi:hypothetical protein